MNFAAEGVEDQKVSDGAKVMKPLDELSTMFRKYGNVFSAKVAQAGGLRLGRLSACPTWCGVGTC